MLLRYDWPHRLLRAAERGGRYPRGGAALVTVTFAVASAAFMSAPVAGVIEEAVRAAAMSAPGAAAFAAMPLDMSLDEGAKRHTFILW